MLLRLKTCSNEISNISFAIWDRSWSRKFFFSCVSNFLEKYLGECFSKTFFFSSRTKPLRLIVDCNGKGDPVSIEEIVRSTPAAVLLFYKFMCVQECYEHIFLVIGLYHWKYHTSNSSSMQSFRHYCSHANNTSKYYFKLLICMLL